MVETPEQVAESKADARGYSKGYAAGIRKAAEERAKERMWQQVFCAALQGTLVNACWTTANKKWSTQAEYVRGCGEIANEAIKQHGWRA